MLKRQTCTNPWSPVMFLRMQAYKTNQFRYLGFLPAVSPHSSPFYQKG